MPWNGWNSRRVVPNILGRNSGLIHANVAAMYELNANGFSLGYSNDDPEKEGVGEVDHNRYIFISYDYSKYKIRFQLRYI